MAATVYVIDDQEAVRHALREMLTVFGFSVETYESADAFLASPPEEPQGCIVADVRMPGTDGIALTRELQKKDSSLPVILISGHADIPMAVAGIKAGAAEFIEKPVDDKHLVAAINRCMTQLLDQRNAETANETLNARFAQLTPRQTEIFDRVAVGMTSAEIAAELKISARTVESYRAEIMDKMQADSVASIVRQAIRLGRITP
ncbi:MAG: response regulator transcription factor [Xanthobacteraceae bacterium]|nr:response regulator transcription factor [Xanthobacteraceae bacterium]QYK45738.1 MAG: response regulator transcription factor [Xanthobacteraceae bacterium]